MATATGCSGGCKVTGLDDPNGLSKDRHPPRDRLRGLGIAVGQNHELVTAEPRDRVTVANAAGSAHRPGWSNSIARGVARCDR